MIKTILFDVDGVFLSEERYFDASALTVWEMLHSPAYLSLAGDTCIPTPEEAKIRSVRELVFASDDVLTFIKSRGINSNWDMVYLAFSYQLIRLCEQLKQADHAEVSELLTNQIGREQIERLQALAHRDAPDFTLDYAAFHADFGKGDAQKSELLTYLNTITLERVGVQTNIFSRSSELWELCQATFQEWYLGDERIADSIGREAFQKGKKGFLKDEIAILEPTKMIAILKQLQAKGYTLGIGTGRPTIETQIPLAELGLLPYFEANRVVTASHVLDAENEYPEAAPLAKPHPYCYLKGLVGLDRPVADALYQDLPIVNGDEVLIVGDSLADMLAARAIGCRFAATLTGLSGQAAREKFEEENVEFIWNDVSEILSVLG